MDYQGARRREVEKVKTKTDEKIELREQGRLLARQLRERADMIGIVLGSVPVVDELRATADLVDELAEAIVIPGAKPKRMAEAEKAAEVTTAMDAMEGSDVNRV